VFAASGDDGAYDANDGNSFPLPEFTKTLSVDDPGSQPFITAAGGTTLPGPQEFLLSSGAIYSVTINYEQAWGWDYLDGLCRTLGLDPVSCGIFPAGGGGGVSIEWPLPSYQFGIPGMQLSQPGQVLIDTTAKPPQVLARLPAFFPGRNVPDISVNSDPDTGYTIYYTSDVNGFAILTFYGGTSFAAPQLNGVASLFDQALGRRVGLLNYPLYNLVRSGQAYGGRNPPLRDIVHGDNWFYQGRPVYDQATGVGVPNIANLLDTLQNPFY
jgi:subtilase family serine protease